MSEDIVKESIKCLANMEIKETTYQVARSVVLEEIERLNNLLKETSQTLSKQTTKAITLKSENERLNNIINELEKWLNEEYEATIFDYRNAIEDVIDKLIELKGSDKE